jgi:hypothetical protein
MRILSLALMTISVFLVGFFFLKPHGDDFKIGQFSQSPHGDNFKISCNVCHSSKGWKLDKDIYSFNHTTTKFPLIGDHTKVDCKMCHPTLVFSEAKTGCIDCHTDVHEATVGPDCNRCHTPHSWLVNDITKIHQLSRFPLLGVHATVDCDRCHKSETFRRFEVLGTECYSCHMENYAATTQPNHISSGYSTQCNDCHTVYSNTWQGSGFDHSFFPLTQGHALNSCTQCHTSGKFTKLSTNCIDCHSTDFNATTNPNHQASNFSTTCTLCHTTVSGWKPTSFDHSKFPLTQGHAINDCSKCHVNGNYANTSSDCYTCHKTDFNATTNPNHQTLAFSTSCTTCHSTAPGWKPATFDHSKFPLTQGHAITDCSKCHVNGNYTTTATDCYACHQSDYNATTNPNHKTLAFSTSCTTCHSTAPGWKPATFDHSKFPLTQGHAINDCSKCHVNGNYTNTATDCYACHQSDYNATTNPNHKTLAFSTSCTTCHSTASGWKPTTYDHSKFPLTQGHAINDCSKCHVNGNYTNTATDCYACHQTDYNATTNPNHQSLNFSTTCTACHTTAPGWKPASYTQHDAQSFPIYSGKHRGQWTNCTDCHANTSNYKVFSCTDCHEHNKTTMDSKHSGVKSYIYNSTNCFNCHPKGSN